MNDRLDPLQSRNAAMEVFKPLPRTGYVSHQRLSGFLNQGHDNCRPDIALHGERFPMPPS